MTMRRITAFCPPLVGAALAAALAAAAGLTPSPAMLALFAAALVTLAPAWRGSPSHVALRRG